MGSLFSSVLKPSRDLRDTMIFQPPGPVNPRDYSDSLDVKMIKSNGKKIELIVCRRSSPKFIIFSHGNAGCNYSYSDFIVGLSNKLGVNVVCYDYQGYSNSEGTYSEEKCYDDLENVVNFTIEELGANKSQVFLMGQSLGTGVTAHYAATHDWTTPIFLISPYKTIISVVMPDAMAMTSSSIDAFQTKHKLKTIECPIKIFHGNDDTLIDVSHSKTLFENMVNKKYEPTYIDNCGHNDILEKINYNEVKKIMIEN